MTRRELLSAFALLPAAGKPKPKEGAFGPYWFDDGFGCGMLDPKYHTPDGGHIIASGRLSSADHEMADGWFAVSECGIHVHPDGIPAQILRGFRDQPVEIVVRKVEKVER